MNRKAWLTVGLPLLPGTRFVGTMPGMGVRAMIRDQAGTVETARWGDQGGEQEEVEAPRSGYQGGVADRRRFTAAVACGRCGERGPADRTDSADDCADPARDPAGPALARLHQQRGDRVGLARRAGGVCAWADDLDPEVAAPTTVTDRWWTSSRHP